MKCAVQLMESIEKEFFVTNYEMRLRDAEETLVAIERLSKRVSSRDSQALRTLLNQLRQAGDEVAYLLGYIDAERFKGEL